MGRLHERKNQENPYDPLNEFKQLIRAGEDPKDDHSRNSSWTQFDCTNPYLVWKTEYTPSQRWGNLSTDAAWRDVVRIWKKTDKPRGVSFTTSVSKTLHISADTQCVNIYECNTPVECEKGLDGPYSGPAAQLIWN